MSVNKNHWQEQTRKMGGDALVEKIESMADDIHGIRTAMENFSKAFPNGDMDGHRRYHEIMIERNHLLRRLTQAALEKTVVGFLWVIIALIGIALWNQFKQNIGAR